ncbi:hypothetical protein CR513_49427, partial [Mucuna pruriens]
MGWKHSKGKLGGEAPVAPRGGRLANIHKHIKDYVDLEAIDAFLGKRDRGENPIIAVLANTYYTLDYCYNKNGKGLRCCTSLLYLWITTHLFRDKKKTACSIKDHH